MCLVDTGCRIQFWRLQLSKKQADSRQMATTDPQSCSVFLASTACTRESRRFLEKKSPRGSLHLMPQVLETSNACLQDTADMHAVQLEDSKNQLGMRYTQQTTRIRMKKNRWDNHR